VSFSAEHSNRSNGDRIHSCGTPRCFSWAGYSRSGVMTLQAGPDFRRFFRAPPHRGAPLDCRLS
jgi:hypothetical protein